MTAEPLHPGLEPFVKSDPVDPGSIVDAVLDLDDFLANDVRLALKEAAWYTRPDLEATIERLHAELDAITDGNGNPLPTVDADMGEARTPQVVALELQAVQREYAASRRVVLMQQLNEDDWTEFQARWKDVLNGEPPYPPAFYADLIARCAYKPRFTPEKVEEFRRKVGRPVMDELWRAAWEVNTRSGVSIPKSSLSSAVLNRNRLG